MGSPLYTCSIIVHRASNVPVSDLNNFSSDPYLRIAASAEQEGQSQQTLTYRTHTVRRTRDPTFNFEWIISGVPSRGFSLTVHLCDEDPGNHDDRLGEAVLRFPSAGESLQEGWQTPEQAYKMHKRNGVLKSKVGTFVAKAVTRGRVGHRCRVWVSVRVIGKAEDQKDRRLYTLGPCRYVQHFSPILGSFLGAAKAPNEDHTQPSLKASTFVSNRIQLCGPVPAALRHRYVGFAPFIKAMFGRKGLKGIILHRALHRQHTMIYRWNKTTSCGVAGEHSYGSLPLKEEGSQSAVSDALARQLLWMTSHGTYGRIFTYVIMLDGEWRFTETGEEFAIQFLSKHTMHSDVSVEIAFSGEFFIRPLHESKYDDEHPPSDPSQFELVIDNDSGTYRPAKDLLPTLQNYLTSARNLAAFGCVTAMDGFDEKLKRWKEERATHKAQMRTGKGKANGKLLQASSSLVASSVNSDEGEALGFQRRDSVDSREVKDALEENPQRATDNEDVDARQQDEK